MDVSIVMPLYKPDPVLLKKVKQALSKQKFKGKKEIIEVNEGWGLAKSMNFGIKNSKYPIVATLHQDCIPVGDDWLNSLLAPFVDESVVATCSDIYDFENKKKYTPLLDEKGCAYRKEALEKVGYFDEFTFLNSGEDMDLYLKLNKIGKIVYPHSTVEHIHPGYLTAKGYKKLQNANTWGTLLRKYYFSLPGWWKPIMKANPLNLRYAYWFWRGFLKGKQDFKR